MTNASAGTRLPTLPRSGSSRRPQAVCAGLIALALACAALLCILPEARLGVFSLCNALFTASERVNAYVYDHFPAPEGQSANLAIALLGLLLLSLAGLCFVRRSRALLLCLAALLSGGQMYFGLSLPWWLHALLLGLFCLGWMRFPPGRGGALFLLIGLLVITLLTALFLPGVHAGLEARSEQVRDWLGRAVGAAREAAPASPDSGAEARHLHDRSLLDGQQDARLSQAFRLVTVAEKQVSQPRWVDFLRVALLLLLTAAVVALPFLPFMWLNARRKKALARQAAFDADDAAQAICALFRHACAYLTWAGLGGGNRPCRAWPDAWDDQLPEAYRARYAQCAALFEEACYSDHAFSEAQRRFMADFLAETERLFFDEAPWKQRLILRYKACLHE